MFPVDFLAFQDENDAIPLYQKFLALPKPSTKLAFADVGLEVDGPFAVLSSKATFVRALDHGVPVVLKCYGRPEDTNCEIEAAIALGTSDVLRANHLVPIRMLSATVPAVRPLPSRVVRVIVMPLYAGCISMLLPQVPRPDTVVRIGRQVLTSLCFLHSKMFVHCDVKPANILMDHVCPAFFCCVFPCVFFLVCFIAFDRQDGCVYLGDYGAMVKIGERIRESTPEYMPSDFTEATPAADLFCLAATLLDLVCIFGMRLQWLNH